MTQYRRSCRLMMAAGLAFVLAPQPQVDAQSYVARLCEATGCQPPAIIRLPRIRAFFPTPRVTPGGAVVLTGQGLGNSVGLTLRLVDFRGTAKSVTVSLLEYGDTYVYGRIPDGTVEVMDQVGIFQVRTGSNQFSNEFPVPFRATRDIRTLTHDDPAVRVVSCGDDSNWDVCNTTIDDDDSHPSGFGKGPSLTTISAGHHNCFACVGTDRGEDQYEILLRRGWRLESMDWFANRFTPKEEAWVDQPSFPAGGTQWRPTIKWYATSDDTANYRINVHITGPVGVPWR